MLGLKNSWNLSTADKNIQVNLLVDITYVTTLLLYLKKKRKMEVKN